MDNRIFAITDEQVIESLDASIERREGATKRKAIQAFILAALGSIHWVGAILAAMGTAAFDASESDSTEDILRSQWLIEHRRKLRELEATLKHVSERFESLGDAIDERVQSEEYLALVRKAFRVWDESDTAEKKRYIGNLISNAAGTQLCSDDVIRLFIDWLARFHEAHFAVIREIFKNPHSTRLQIWVNIYGERVKDNSAEADLFKMLVHELTTGYVIRQAREVDAYGQYIQKPRTPSTRILGVKVMKSPFDNVEQYELTELGKQFVHYTMNEAVTRLA